jgi:hypothetical protein
LSSQQQDGSGSEWHVTNGQKKTWILQSILKSGLHGKTQKFTEIHGQDFLFKIRKFGYTCSVGGGVVSAPMFIELEGRRGPGQKLWPW